MTASEQRQPSRKDMELTLARNFGYEDYESFRAGVTRSIGQGGLRRLEKELEKYGPAESETPR
jgi:hypothetical protein